MQRTKKALQHAVIWGLAFLLVLFVQQSIHVATAAVTTVSTYEELAVAIDNASPEDTIVIDDDIDLIDKIEVNKSLSIISAGESVTIATIGKYRHFKIIGDNIMLNFSDIVLDGNGVAGGIESNADNLVLTGVLIQNCLGEDKGINHQIGGGIFVNGRSLTLHNSKISASWAAYGGGLYGKNSTIEIFNCEISGNESRSGGGGIYAENSILEISECEISENKGYEGGGIWGGNSSVKIMESQISNNKATWYGGGIYGSTNMHMINSMIFMNKAYSGGGIAGGSLQMENSKIFSNEAKYGGGIELYSGSKLGGGEIYDNFAEHQGGGIIVRGDAEICDTKIYDNMSYYGGGIYISSILTNIPTVLVNTEIYNNKGEEGGGILVDVLDNLTISGNSIIANNFAERAFHINKLWQIDLHNTNISSTVTWTQGYDYIYNGLDVSSYDLLPIGYEIEVIECYSDDAYPETWTPYFVTEEEDIEIQYVEPEGYKADIQADVPIQIDTDKKTITIYEVTQNISITITYHPIENHSVTVITRYRDGAFPEQSQSYQVADGNRFEAPLEIHEGYHIVSFNARSISYGIDEDTQTVYISSVLQDHTITIELERNLYTVDVVTSFQDGSRDDITERFQVLYGDFFDGIFDVPDGYRVRGVEANLFGLTVDWYAHTISVDRVTQNMQVTIFLNT